MNELVGFTMPGTGVPFDCKGWSFGPKVDFATSGESGSVVVHRVYSVTGTD